MATQMCRVVFCLLASCSLLVVASHANSDEVIARLGHNRFLHGRQVFAITFSPDGSTLLSGSEKNTILWARKTGKAKRVFVADFGPFLAVQYSPDGKLIATGSKGAVAQIWDAESGALLHTLRGHQGALKTLAFTPDGAVLATGDFEGSIRLWNPTTGKQISQLDLDSGSINVVAFSPDGAKLVSGSSRPPKAIVWDWKNGKPLVELNSPRVNVASICFSPDGKHAAAGANNSVDVWQTDTGDKIRELAQQKSRVTCIGFSPDGSTLLTGAIDKTIRAWDFATGKQRFEAKGHLGMIQQLACSPDGKAIASCGLTTGSHNYDYTIRLWDVATGKQLPTTQGSNLPLESVAISPDGSKVATARVDEGVSIWDVSSGKRLHDWHQRDQGRNFVHVAFSPDGKVLATTMTDSVGLWDVETGKLLGAIPVAAPLIALAFAPDGKTLSVGNGRSIVTICDVEQRKVRAECVGHTNQIWCVTYSPDSRMVASASWDKSVRLWDISTGQLRFKYTEHDDRVRWVSFSPDGRMVASISNDAIVVKEIVTGTTVARLTEIGKQGGANALAFASDHRTIVSGNWNNEIICWDLATGKSYLRRNGKHGPWICGMSLSADGRRMVTGSSDGMAVVWDLPKLTASKTAIVSEPPWRDAWLDLASADGAVAYRSLWTLAGDKQATLKKMSETLKFDSDAGKELEVITGLIRQLDDDQFRTREIATKRLLEFGAKARPLLERVWKESLSVEKRFRIRQILKILDRSVFQPLTSPTALRRHRSIQLLEYFADEEAKVLLKRIAENSPSQRESSAAKASLRRLNRAASAAP